MSTTLGALEARTRAEDALHRLWPGWAGRLEPLKPLGGPVGFVPFRASGGPEPVVVKVWATGLRDKAEAQAARQAEVARAMTAGPFRAPEVLDFDAQAAALVMRDAGGCDLLAALRAADDPGAERLLQEAGGWIAAFHATTARDHPFRPAGHVNWAERIVAEAERGGRVIVDLPLVRAGAAGLAEMAPDVRKRPARRAVTHRDLTAANLVKGADGALWGIDFENAREDEPLRDMVSLALDVLAFAPFGRDPARALRALREGHGETGTAPQARLFLQRAFALGVIARTPPAPSRRQAALRAAAGWLLAQDGPLL